MDDDATAITLTERAARRIAELVEQEKVPNGKLRVAVSGGGCSGFAYGFSFDDKVEDGDLVVAREGARVVIDSVSLMYLTGSEIDYVNELAGSYFTVRNPNAIASCGCGNSFAVAL